MAKTRSFKKISVLMTGTIALCGVLAFGSTADAETTTFSGLECVYIDGLRPNIYYSEGNAWNEDSLHDVSFQCPMDRPNSNQSGSLTNIYVRVNDGHSSEAVECFATSCDPLGTSCASTAIFASPGTGRTFMNMGSVTDFINGYAYLECRLPNREDPNDASGVLSYRFND